MSSHRLPDDFNRFLATSSNVIQDPGSGGTFDLTACPMFGMATIASGTRKLPDNMPLGTVMYVYATGSVTITNVAGATVATLATGEVAECQATTSTTWVATISKPSATGSTAAGVSIADAGSYTAATNVETVTQLLLARTKPGLNTAITTVGAGTLTAAGLVGGLITRSGSTAAYIDTTATAAQIFADLGTVVGASDGASWVVAIKNTVAFAETIIGGDDVILTGQSIIPPNSTGLFRLSTNGADQIDMVGFGTVPQAHMPQTKFSTSSTVTSLTYAADVITGAQHVYWQNTADGAVAATTRTATQMFGDIPNAHIGLSFQLTIVNRGDNTVTFTAGTGVTITGEATIATLTTRTYHATFTSATAITFTSVNKGTIET